MTSPAEAKATRMTWMAVVATGAAHPDEETREACRAAVGRALASVESVASHERTASLEEFAACVEGLAEDPLEPLELDEGSLWAAWALLHGSGFRHLRVSGRAVVTEETGTLFAYRRGRLVGNPFDPAAASEKSRAGCFLVRRFDCWNARAARGGVVKGSLVEREAAVGGGLAIRIPTPSRWRRHRVQEDHRGRIAIGSSDLLDPWFYDEQARARWTSDGVDVTASGARLERTSGAFQIVAGKPEAAMRLMARLAGGDHLVLGLRESVGHLLGPREGSGSIRFCRDFEFVPPTWATLARMRPIEVEPELRRAIARWYGVPRAWATPEFLESL